MIAGCRSVSAAAGGRVASSEVTLMSPDWASTTHSRWNVSVHMNFSVVTCVTVVQLQG